jgi:methylmalonyl-CoA mutase
VSNAADGSYYIEALTQTLAERSVRLVKDIESSGGLLSQLKEGTIQRKISESAAKEQLLFNDGTLVLVGTNKHPNQQDRMKDDLELYPFLKHNPRKTLIKPITEKRLAQAVEQKRLADEE